MSSAVNHFQIPGSILYIAMSVLVPAAAIYVWGMLAKVMVRLWQRI
jgi:hypothetical protein